MNERMDVRLEKLEVEMDKILLGRENRTKRSEKEDIGIEKETIGESSKNCQQDQPKGNNRGKGQGGITFQSDWAQQIQKQLEDAAKADGGPNIPVGESQRKEREVEKVSQRE